MIWRGNVTDAVLAAVGTVGKPVGDANTPNVAFGWDGQPNALGTNFIPYVVVFPQAASIKSGPIAVPSADWQLPYTITSYGVTREQVEWLADRARNTLSSLRGATLDGGDATYSVIKATTETIGTVSRQDISDPPFFAQTDTVSVWVSQEIGA